MKRLVFLFAVAVLFRSIPSGAQPITYSSDDWFQSINLAQIKQNISNNVYSSYLPILLTTTAHDRVGVMTSSSSYTVCNHLPFLFKSLQDFVEVRIDRNCVKPMQAFSYTFVFNIATTDGALLGAGPNISGTYISAPNARSLTCSLTITYDPTAGVKYKDYDVFKFSNAHAFDLKLAAVYNNNVSSTTPLSISSIAQLPDCIEFRSIVRPERIDLAGTGAPFMSFAASANGRLSLSWGIACSMSSFGVSQYYPAPKGVEYELEWTYVDDYRWNTANWNATGGGMSNAFTSSSSSSSAYIEYNFTNNATRVRVRQPQYDIPIIYQRGAIVYRVRTVSPNTNDYSKVIYGNWSLPDQGTVAQGTAINVGSSNLSDNAYIIGSGHQENLNWQYSINFAEEGKYKHVINYLDGALKNHQTQTKLNTDNNYVVAVDRAFDYEGRPAITSLPTPIQQIGLNYRSDVLNKPLSTPSPLAAADFDNRNGAHTACIVPSSSTPTTPSLAGTGSAAELYYSSANPLNTPGNLHAFVPKSEGFPYSQTVFAPENPKKVLAQGGPGPNFQIYSGGSGHYTVNDYLTPDQSEVNLLLGTEVGQSQFYSKTITTDPNGQTSVSITNKYDKPVMSYLAGAAPANLNSLPGASSSAITGTNDKLADFNQLRSPGLIKADAAFSLDGPGSPVLNYSALVKPFPICYISPSGPNTPGSTDYLQIPARLKLKLTDACGAPIPLTPPSASSSTTPVSIYDVTFGARSANASVSGNAHTTPSNLLTTSLPKGVYSYTKELSFDKREMEQAVKDYVAAHLSVTGSTVAATAGCLYAAEEYFIASKVLAVTPCTQANSTNTAPALPSPCDAIRRKMKEELWPGHKYGIYVKNTNTGQFVGGAANSVANSIFTVTGVANNLPHDQSTTQGNTTTTTHYWVDNSVSPAVIKKTITTTVTTYTSTFTTCSGVGLPSPLVWTQAFCNGWLRLPCGTDVYTHQRCNMGKMHTGHCYVWGVTMASMPPCSPVINFDCKGFVQVPNVQSTTQVVTTVPYVVTCIYRFNSNCITNHIVNIKGGKTLDLYTASAEELIENFNDEIAEALLPLHPEYCKLKFCGDDDFVKVLANTTDFHDAQAKGLFDICDMTNNPNSSVSGAKWPASNQTSESGNCLIGQDPLYTASSNSPADKGLWYSKLMYLPGYSSSPGSQWGSSWPNNSYIDPRSELMYRLALGKAYCNAGNGRERNECASGFYGNEIPNYVFLNDEVKQRYWDNLRNMYIATHMYWKQKAMEGAISGACGPCAADRMTLIGDPVVPNSIASGSSSPADNFDPNLFNLSGQDATILNIANLYGDGTGSSLTSATQVNTVINSLNNGSNPGVPTYVQAAKDKRAEQFLLPIKDVLTQAGKYTAIFNSVTAKLSKLPVEEITPAYMDGLLNGSPVTVNEKCNAYLLDYNLVRIASDEMDTWACGSQSLYDDVKDFANRLLSAQASSSAITLSSANAYDNKLLTALGAGSPQSCSISLATTTSSVNNNNVSVPQWKYTLSTSSASVDVFVSQVLAQSSSYALPSGNSFSAGLCINGQGVPSDGYVAKSTALLRAANGDKYVLWSKNISLMTPIVDADMQRAVNAWDIRDAVNSFITAKTTFKYSLTYNDPLFRASLANFLNERLHKNYSFDKYEALMQGCALSDYFNFSRSLGSGLVTGNATTNLTSMLKQLAQPVYNNTNGSNTSTTYNWHLGTDAVKLNYLDNNNVRYIYLDFSSVPLQYVNSVYDYFSIQFGSAFTANPSNPTGAAATVFLPASYSSFSIPSSGYMSVLSVSGPTSVTLEKASGGVSCNKYDIVFSSGASTQQKSDALEALKSFFAPPSSSYPDAIVYYQSQLLRSSDYHTTAKANYLAAANSSAITNHSQAVAALMPATVGPLVATASSNTYTYTEAQSTGKLYHFYTRPNTSINSSFNPLYIALSGYSSLIGVGVASLNVGSASSGFTGTKRQIRKANGCYWFIYDSYPPDAAHPHGDALYNAYLLPPQNVDITGYSINLSTLAPAQCDANGNFYGFTVDVTKSTSAGTLTVHCTGYTDFAFINGGNKLQDVILYESPDARTYEPADCEYQKMLTAIEEGKAAYYQYYTKLINDKVQEYVTFLQDPANVTEHLFLTKTDNQYQYTLYFYDRAGNLMRTVSPQGVTRYTGASSNIDVAKKGTPAQQVSRMVSYTKATEYVYNSLNLPYRQTTPDGGAIRFYYDIQGKPAFAQNGVQSAKSGSGWFYYTYYLYDDLGRPIETGEVKLNEPTLPEPKIITDLGNHAAQGTMPSDVRNAVTYATRTQVVITEYDAPTIFPAYTTPGNPKYALYRLSPQENLHNRIAAVKYFRAFSFLNNTNFPEYGLHYSYDAEGNVKTLIHEIGPLASINQQFKRIDYDYDVISGKVNMVSYNRGFPDQFYHHYAYDADNRIQTVETSHDGVIWATDAAYNYYKHGPLAQVNVGDLSVQSLQYAYTLQGWLKSINGDLLNPNADMGQNGKPATGSNDVTDPIARDAIAHDLQYFPGDYIPIGSSAVEQISNATALSGGASSLARPLYNGNIARQYTSIASISSIGATDDYYGMERSYLYDQLNRISTATNKVIDNPNGVLLASGMTPSNLYQSEYSYDADGNILTLKRWDGGAGTGTSSPTAASKFDDFSYDYFRYGNNSSYHNQLQNVTESASSPTAWTDIKPFSPATGTGSTYQYDQIGNLVKDQRGGLGITWNLYNKATTISKNLSGTQPMTINFSYDGLGNRYRKEVITGSANNELHAIDYYIRDAQGNVLAVYKDLQNYSKSAVISGWHNQLANGIGGTITGRLTIRMAVLDVGSRFPSIPVGILHGAMLSDPKFVDDLVASRPSSYYVLHDPDVTSRLMTETDDYLDALRGYADTLGRTGAQAMGAAIASSGDEDQRTLLGYIAGAGQDMLTELLVQFASVSQEDVCQKVWGLLGGEYSRDNLRESAASLAADLSERGTTNQAIDGIMNVVNGMKSGDEGPGTVSEFMQALVGDSVLFTAPALRSEKGELTPFERSVMAMINNQADKTWMGGFINQWQPAVQWISGNISSDQKLQTMYGIEPDTVIGGLIEQDLAVIEGALVKEDGLSLQDYMGALTNAAAKLSPAQLSLPMSMVTEEFGLAEHHIYGSSRLGIQYYDWDYGNPSSPVLNQLKNRWDANSSAATATFYNLNNRSVWYSYAYGDLVDKSASDPWGNWDRGGASSGTANGSAKFGSSTYYQTGRTLGWRHYELTDHLGNVLATILDRKVGSSATHTHTSLGVVYNYFKADVATATDMYPFGMEMVGRTYSSASSGPGLSARHGFNGQQKDDEVYGKGNSLDFNFRGLDTRLGRFRSRDPLAAQYPWNSTYAFAENDVIRSIDLEGRERSIVIYDFSSEKITRTKIGLPKAGPLGNGVLVQSNYGGKITYFYGNDIPNGNVTSFKKAYEGVRLDKAGNHVGYNDSKGFPTIGYGHRIKEGEPYKIGGAITDDEAKGLFKNDQNWIFKRADKLLSNYSLSDNQKNALYDASFNMGPEKMSQYNEGSSKFSGENFFLQFMGDGDAVSKRRYAENLLYSEGMYLHLDVIKNSSTKATAGKIVNDATVPPPSTNEKTKTSQQ
jgi:RHS repeat-associated protein